MDLEALLGERRVPFLRILRPGAGSSLQLVILSDQLQPFATHWAEGREQVCRAELERPCQWCNAGGEKRVSLYAIAMLTSKRGLGIVHITAGAFSHCQELQDQARSCRGLVIGLHRMGGGQAGVRASVLAGRLDPAQLPTAEGWLRPALFRLWRVLPLATAADLAAAELPDGLAHGELPADHAQAGVSIPPASVGLAGSPVSDNGLSPKQIGPGCAGRIEDGSAAAPRVSMGRIFRDRKGGCNGN